MELWRCPVDQENNMGLKTFGALCLIAGILIAATVAYHNSDKGKTPIVFSPKDTLASIWRNYKIQYLEKSSGRTLDKQHNNITTSEAESYTMLRAVWMDDQQTFDQSWAWTSLNLARPKDHLFSWLYGRKPNGRYGIRTDIGGQNSASDADTDIALSLIFAYSRWQQDSYLGAAKLIVNDIWNQEVVIINNKPYLLANNVEKLNGGQEVVINPSYFEPYAYKLFAQIDHNHAWLALADNSYDVIKASLNNNLDKSVSGDLPPNWIYVDRLTGAISAPKNNLDTNYGFDAMRVPWHMALSWEWNQDSRAQEILSMMKFLSTEWNKNHALDAQYGHDGRPAAEFEAPAMYGTSLGYFLVSDAQNATSVYETKIISLYDPDKNDWRQTLSYYDDNWAWFGLALYYNFLPNLAEHVQLSSSIAIQ